MSINHTVLLPPGSWDSHVHVVDEEASPFAPNHPFRPKKASLEDLLDFESKIGGEHVCLVAISVYGTDNALLLESLRQLKGRGRGVVSVDPNIVSDAELDSMHALGVRGVRVNLKSASIELDKAALVDVLWRYADKIRRLKWAIQLHIGLADIGKIAETVPKLGVPVVIDHLGTPDEKFPAASQPGYDAFMNLLSRKEVWVKLSGIYRFAGLPDMEKYIQDILRIAPTQVVWASDWPHTGGAAANPDGDRTKVQHYRKVDVPAFIKSCRQWCEEEDELIHKIFVENPRKLWQYDGDDVGEK